jgi:thiamine biosynthesis protein ThiS
VNMQVIKKSEYASLSLHDMDALEIVNFVGGG